MALASLQLSWQWPAGRTPDHKLLLDVRKVGRQRIRLSRLFSRVESAADYLPDAMELTGTVILGREHLLGANATLRVPRIELASISAGDRAGLGIIDQDGRDRNICICIKSAPDGLGSKELKDWLANMECSS